MTADAADAVVAGAGHNSLIIVMLSDLDHDGALITLRPGTSSVEAQRI